MVLLTEFKFMYIIRYFLICFQGLFVIWFVLHLASGALAGMAFARQAKNLTSQVGVFVLSISIMLLVATIFWSVPKCEPYEPYELEKWRLANKQ